MICGWRVEGNLVSTAQPAALAYRSSTLYGASEQAVGGATAVAALSIASIIGPQVRPDFRPSRWRVEAYPSLDLSNTGQTLVCRRLLRRLRHTGMHTHWLCESATVASLGSPQEETQVRPRHATTSHGRLPACQSLRSCTCSGNGAGNDGRETCRRRWDCSSCWANWWAWDVQELANRYGWDMRLAWRTFR